MHPMETVFPSNCFHMCSCFILHLFLFDISTNVCVPTHECTKQTLSPALEDKGDCFTLHWWGEKLGVNNTDFYVITACQC